MTKRPLTDDEKNIYNKQLLVNIKAKEINEGELKKTEFELDFSIDHDSRMKKIRAEKYIRDLKHEIKDSQDNIETINKHLEEGVEVKENGRE